MLKEWMVLNHAPVPYKDVAIHDEKETCARNPLWLVGINDYPEAIGKLRRKCGKGTSREAVVALDEIAELLIKEYDSPSVTDHGFIY